MSTVVPAPAGSYPLDDSLLKAATLQNAVSTDGDGTTFDITGMATVVVTIDPTSYTGTVTFKASADGAIFDVIRGCKQGTTTVATSVANPGSTKTIWEFQTAGLTKFKAVLSSSGGTSITVTAKASPHPNSNPIGVTLSSAVLAAGSANVGAVQQATNNDAVALGTTTAAQVIKASAGYLSGVLVTAVDTGNETAISIYDNASAASGTKIGYVPANAAVGSFWPFNMPAANGITAGKVNHSHAITVAFS